MNNASDLKRRTRNNKIKKQKKEEFKFGLAHLIIDLSIKNQLQLRQQKILGLSRTLQAISPLASLARGYAIVSDATSKKILRNSKEVKSGQKIITQLAKGKLLCEVKAKL